MNKYQSFSSDCIAFIALVRLAKRRGCFNTGIGSLKIVGSLISLFGGVLKSVL